MDLSHVLIWNVRGLNSVARRDADRVIVNSYKIDVVCLQETKITAISWQIILSMLGSEFDNNYIFLSSVGVSGGILIAWRSCLGPVSASRVDTFSTSVQFNSGNRGSWWLTCVYGPQDNQAKIQFLQELRDVRSQCTSPCMVAGDFNLIYRDEDKNNSNVNRAMMGRFKRWIDDMAVNELPLHGRKFTWSSSSDSASPTLVDWTECFALLTGRKCFLIASFRAQLLMILTTACLSSVYVIDCHAKDASILKHSGPALMDSRKPSKRRGLLLKPVSVLWKLYLCNIKQLQSVCKAGVKRELAISDPNYC